MRKREFEVLGEELLDVWALHVIGLLEFNDLEDLQFMESANLISLIDVWTYVD